MHARKNLHSFSTSCWKKHWKVIQKQKSSKQKTKIARNSEVREQIIQHFRSHPDVPFRFGPYHYVKCSSFLRPLANLVVELFQSEHFQKRILWIRNTSFLCSCLLQELAFFEILFIKLPFCSCGVQFQSSPSCEKPLFLPTLQSRSRCHHWIVLSLNRAKPESIIKFFYEIWMRST